MGKTEEVRIPTSVDDAKAFLLQSDAKGNNLYDHLADVIAKLLEQKPQQAFQNFENLSSGI